jgi:hypothetical protein
LVLSFFWRNYTVQKRRGKGETKKESQDPLTSAEAIGGGAAAAILKDISMDLSMDEGSNGVLF